MAVPARIRPLREADDGAVAALFADAHAAEPRVRPLTEERWRAFVEYAGNGGGRDFAVAEEGDRIVGLLISTVLPGLSRGRVRRHLRIGVLQGRRRRGIGSALLDHAGAQPLEGPRPTLQAYLRESATASLAFFRSRGFETVHSDLEMDREGPPPAARTVEGGVLRPFRPGPGPGGEGDAAAWARLHNGAFGEEFTFERFDADRVDAEMRLDGARATMAEAGGRVVGFCYTHTADPVRGCLQSLVVESGHRRRGFGRALVAGGLRTLAGQGRACVELGVDGGNAGARALYLSMGFRPREASLTLWRDR